MAVYICPITRGEDIPASCLRRGWSKHVLELPAILFKHLKLKRDAKFNMFLASSKSNDNSTNTPPDLIISFLDFKSLNESSVNVESENLFKFFDFKSPLPYGNEMGSLGSLATILAKADANVHRLSTHIATPDTGSYASLLIELTKGGNLVSEEDALHQLRSASDGIKGDLLAGRADKEEVERRLPNPASKLVSHFDTEEFEHTEYTSLDKTWKFSPIDSYNMQLPEKFTAAYYDVHLDKPKFALVSSRGQRAYIKVRFLQPHSHPIHILFEVENEQGKCLTTTEWFKEKKINILSYEAYPFDKRRSTTAMIIDAEGALPDPKAKTDNYQKLLQEIRSELFLKQAYTSLRKKFDQVVKRAVEYMYQNKPVSYSWLLDKVESGGETRNENGELVQIEPVLEKDIDDTRAICDSLPTKAAILWCRIISGFVISNKWRAKVLRPFTLYCRPDDEKYSNFHETYTRLDEENYFESYLADQQKNLPTANAILAEDHFLRLFRYSDRLKIVDKFVEKAWDKMLVRILPHFNLHDYEHCRRVAFYSHFLADGLMLSEEESFLLGASALLHDIGMGDPARINSVTNAKTPEIGRRTASDIRAGHAERSGNLAHSLWVNSAAIDLNVWPRHFRNNTPAKDLEAIFHYQHFGILDKHWSQLNPNNVFETLPSLDIQDYSQTHGERPGNLRFYNSVMACGILNRERRVIEKIVKAHAKSYEIESRMWDERTLERQELVESIDQLSKSLDQNEDPVASVDACTGFLEHIHNFIAKPLLGRSTLLAALLRIADGIDFAVERIPLVRWEEDHYNNYRDKISKRDRYEYAINAVVKQIRIDKFRNSIIIQGGLPGNLEFDGVDWDRIKAAIDLDRVIEDHGLITLLDEVKRRIDKEIESVTPTLKRHGVPIYEVVIEVEKKSKIKCPAV